MNAEHELRAAGATITSFAANGAGPHPAPLAPFPTLSLEDCAAAPRRGYLLKGMIAPGDLCILAGEPGAGKSVLAPFLAHAIATGAGAFGRRARPAPVLYVAAEDGTGAAQRFAALRQVLGGAPGLHLLPQRVLLLPDAQGHPGPDLARLVLTADRLGAGLVVLDTFAAGFAGLRENDADAMGQAIATLRALRGADGRRAVLLAHHVPKGGTTPRGHGSLDGDADVTLLLSRDPETGTRTVTFGKNRNGPATGRHAFAITGHELDRDEDGDPITAPILTEADDPCGGRNKGRVPPPQARLALDFLRAALGTGGNTLPRGAMFPTTPGLQGITTAEWRVACKARGLSEGDTERAFNQAFRRAGDTLAAMGLIGRAMQDGTTWVWLARG